MAYKRKKQLTKQLCIVGGVLVLFELGYLFMVPHPKALSIKEAIQTQLDRQNVDDKRKEQLRIQLSIEDYMRKNGQLPEKLDSLIPTYFENVPKIPDSNDPFEYYIKDGKYYIGDSVTIQSIKGGGQGKSATPNDTIPILDSNAPIPVAIQNALINSLTDQAQVEAASFTYDSTGKRDPFRPFNFAPQAQDDQSKTPLERYDVSQLKVTAILGGKEDDSTATVENAAGKGFIVKKGTKIGTNGGEVTDIQSDRIVVVETIIDFTGQKKSKTIEMRLRTKDQEKALKE